MCYTRFFKSIDDAYTHANRTLLSLLLRDQQLIPRLRSLKRYFFLSHSSFLTHLLDLSSTELRKPAKSASLVKLQSLLDLALNSDADALGEDAMFREDVRVTMSGTGLYEWLLKVVSVSGAIGEEGEGGEGHGVEETRKEKDKDKDKDEKKQQILGTCRPLMSYAPLRPHSNCYSFTYIHIQIKSKTHTRTNCSYRCAHTGLHGQVPALARHLAQDDPAIPAHLPLPPPPQTRRAIPLRNVGRTQDHTLASSFPLLLITSITPPNATLTSLLRSIQNNAPPPPAIIIITTNAIPVVSAPTASGRMDGGL